ncbi:MAG: hypothetical protein R2824_28470 [Saprospiraceae bacterium]
MDSLWQALDTTSSKPSEVTQIADCLLQLMDTTVYSLKLYMISIIAKDWPHQNAGDFHVLYTANRLPNCIACSMGDLLIA